MALPLQITRDNQGYMTSGGQTCRDFATYIQRFELTATDVFTIDVPTSQGPKLIAYFSFNKAADVFVQPGASPTLTFPDGTADTNPSELNPIARIVYSGQVLQFLTGDADVYVTISYFEYQ